MDIIIAKHAIVVSTEVPPYEINGNGMPTTGSKPITMPMLMSAEIKNRILRVLLRSRV